ncbi:MAG: iron chelate uptake ABC transporter family permease subunit [Micrococcaceae bacterium]|nr:iron chelate uptake ABC transporter family permease subunit [Micrococcaceae bacterium]
MPRALLLIAPAVLAVLAALASLALGARPVPVDAAVGALTVAALHGPAAVTGMDGAAVLSRVPRTLAAILVGAGLAVAGAALQGATRNPLGDPGLLGLTAGTVLAFALGIALGVAG